MKTPVERYNDLFWPAVFNIFALMILTAILVIRPGWGFMDDHSNLNISRDFWLNPSIEKFSTMLSGDMQVGRFRPLYMLWIITAYPLGLQAPHLVYFFITLTGLLTLPLWGLSLDRVFNGSGRSPFLIWAYPLAFFIFTPFWNSLMYISTLEKFVYLFSAPAVFYFLRAYDRASKPDLALAFLWSLLATLGKETGASLFLAFALYAFFDAVFFKRRPGFSWGALAVSAAIFTGYYSFMKNLLKNYTAKYASSLNIHDILARFCDAPLFIKVLAGLSIALLIREIINQWSRARHKEAGRTLFAWLTLCYILVLLPWGFMNYLLAPLAAFVIAAALPFFQIGDGHRAVRAIKRAGMIILVFLVGIFITLPSIQKIADKRMVVEAIKKLSAQTPPAAFFYPSPYMETAAALHSFTRADIAYLKDNQLLARDIPDGLRGYLILNDECAPAALTDVGAGDKVYANSTWAIYALIPKTGERVSFKPPFAQNRLQQLKNFLKAL